jgi:hypothetical protein
MTKLYPIGTLLITKRLSQAALAHELGFLIQILALGFSLVCDSLGKLNDTWIVTVTKDNQELLSPVPIIGDLVDVYKEYSVFTPMYFSKFEFELSENFSAVVKRIIERTYPNGQRAPLIEWDEVILPETKGE